jgi:hypothetical protein
MGEMIFDTLHCVALGTLGAERLLFHRRERVSAVMHVTTERKYYPPTAEMTILPRFRRG